MITTNVFSRTLHLKYLGNSATGFLIDVDEKQYLVTAKHFLKDVIGNISLDVFHDNQWKTVSATLVGHAENEIDITVLSFPFGIAPRELYLEPNIAGLIYGQEVYFLGYPFGLFGDVGTLNTNYPMPFVKRAIVSCMNNSGNDPQILFLDGQNNKGFSGGPVVFRAQNSSDFKVAAVISGYKFDSEPVFLGEMELPISYRYNTGIIITYGIKHAVDIAKQNPIGFSLLG